MERKQKNIILVISIVLLIVVIGVIGGLSYALWTYTANQGTVNKVTSDCIEVSITDETEVISLANAYPITDEQAKSLSPYTFKVTNKCNTETAFDVNLEIMDVTSRLNSDFVAVSFNEGPKSILGNNISVDPTYNKSDYTAVEAYNLGNDKLAGGKSKSYTLRLWMDESVTVEDDVMNKKFVSKISVTATVANPICQRATELHTDICNRTDTTGYCRADGYAQGATITYGNLGTTGTLTSGDAFDCDVNGDGNFDSKTERFYYVSDYYNTETNTFDPSYATLIYYNNVSEGVANNTTKYAYNTNNASYLGPQTAMLQLPKLSNWKNVDLRNKIRNIQDNNGITRVTGYSYGEYAARFLTYQEAENGCYDGTNQISSQGAFSNKCKFLYQNTDYSLSGITSGYWIETPHATNYQYAWIVYGNSRRVFYYNVDNSSYYGVRPVIEVAKSKIDY